MQVVYALEQPPEQLTKSIFLAGPSPRDPEHPNWRVEALALLEEMGFDGEVFVPLPRDGQWAKNYDDQVTWETRFLHLADKIVFWVPRSFEVTCDVAKGTSAERAMTLPALTTNMEFGLWVETGKAILAYPKDAPKLRYLQSHADENKVPTAHTLREALGLAVDALGPGAPRTGGEREVPLYIWKLPHFQAWYAGQKAAGNRLDGARVLWSFRVGPTKGFTFAFALHVNVHIASEGRNKTNEFIFGRPDIATIVAYGRIPISHASRVGEMLVEQEQDSSRELHARHILELARKSVGVEGLLQNTEVALIREFRSPARTSDGFIHEIPGGSSWKPGEDPFVTMTHELEEETGLGEKAGFAIDPSRLRKVGSRQVAGTLSVHQAHVFACELRPDEMAFLKKQAADNVVNGVEADTERTYVEVYRLGDLLSEGSNLVDWSMLGMVLTALVQPSKR